MKIGLVLDRFDVAAGGLARWVDGFARYLLAEGHEPTVLAFEATADRPIPLPVPVHVLARAPTVLARARSAAAGVAALGADVVLDTGTSAAGDVFMPCTGSRRQSQRALVGAQSRARRLRAAASPVSRLLDLSLARLEGQQVRRARHIIAVSNLVRDVLLAGHGLAPAKISVVPNGVDTARFAPERLQPMRAELRARLGVGQGVLFLGSAHNMWLKGMDTAITALDLLVYEEADVHLAIAGSPPDDRWRKLAQASAGRIHFLGLVQDMAPVFAAADALVHPTRWDACSLSTLEAAAAGLPVVTTRRNGAAELITEGVTGYVLEDANDVAALADRMRRLLEPALRRRMGDAARASMEGHDAADNFGAVLAILETHRPGGSAGVAP